MYLPSAAPPTTAGVSAMVEKMLVTVSNMPTLSSSRGAK